MHTPKPSCADIRDDRVVVLTGASRGIGAETARLLGARGMRLLLVSRDRTALQHVADAVARAGGEALVHPADLSQPGEARAAVEAAVMRFGRLDVLINNAGYGMQGFADQIPMEEITRLFAVNFFAAIEAMQAAMPIMLAAKRGQIVNISSLAADFPSPFQEVYSASKAALTNYSRALRLEVAPLGIRVSTVFPTVTHTEFFTAMKNFFHGNEGATLGHVPAQGVEPVARSIVRCLDRPARDVYPLPLARAIIILGAILPQLAERIVGNPKRVLAVFKREGRSPR